MQSICRAINWKIIVIKLKEILQELTKTDIDSNYEGPTAKQYSIHAAFRAFDPKTNIIIFKVWDFLGSKKQHQVKFRMVDYDSIRADDDFPEEKLKMALTAGELQVHCTCKGFTFNGFAYITHTLDSNLKPNTIKPTIRNPQEIGIVCKHIKGLLDNINKYIPTIARRLTSDKIAGPSK